MMVASFGTLGRVWSATVGHWALAMKAEPTRRPDLPAWASPFLMKCTWQSYQVAHSTLGTAAFTARTYTMP